MNRLPNYLAALAVMVFFCACNRKQAQLEFTNANGEVAPLTNLEFRFSKSLMPDSLLQQQWDSYRVHHF